MCLHVSVRKLQYVLCLCVRVYAWVAFVSVGEYLFVYEYVCYSRVLCVCGNVNVDL